MKYHMEKNTVQETLVIPLVGRRVFSALRRQPGCMRGYRDIYRNVGLFHKMMIRFCDGPVRMKIVRIVFGG